MSEPLVSICIPSYNHARFLPEAIDSALGQTYRNIEIIIVDDGSTDHSLRIAQDYAVRHPSLIQVFTHPDGRNHGISATVNFGFNKSKGEYWSGLPSDDVLYSDKVERQVEFLENHSGVGFVYSSTDLIDQEGRKIGSHRPKDISDSRSPLESLIVENAIPGLTVLARRQCVERAGDHDETLIYSDWEFWIRMAAQCKMGFLPGPLAMSRLHTYNTSVGIRRELDGQYQVAVMQRLKEKFNFMGGALGNSRTRALIDLQLGCRRWCVGQHDKAVQSLLSAVDIDPSLKHDLDYLSWWIGNFEKFPALLVWTLVNVSKLLGSALGENLSGRFSKSLLSQAAIDNAYQSTYAGRYGDAKDYFKFALKLNPVLSAKGQVIRLAMKLFLGQENVYRMRRLKQIVARREKKILESQGGST